MYSNGIRNCCFRACCAICAVAMTPLGTGLRASAQAASKDLSFEVATVKPVIRDASHPFSPGHYWAHVTPAGASYWSMSIADLVEYAYDVEPIQVTGPELTTADYFDIEARFPAGADKKDNRKMLQALLEDRFALAFHIEKKELESYALVVGKHGAKLSPSPSDPPTLKNEAASKSGDSNAREESSKPMTTKDGFTTVDMGQRGTMTIGFDQATWSNHFAFSKSTMEKLAGRLSTCLGNGVQKVVDETGVKGSYQVAYDCPLPRPPMPGGTNAADLIPPDPQGSSFVNQSLDALGLKLEKRKILMDVYVVDHVERPSPN